MSDPVKSIWLAFLLFTFGCASVTPPTGGPKDTEPPKLRTMVPANLSLNYTGKTIALEFDEQVEFRDLQKELIITPLTENTYETRVKKNTIQLEFEKPLEPNTTYTLNFRKAIRDLTEGNAASIPPITFSTGSYLDSGYVSGMVVRLLTQQPEAEADVLLYRAGDTGTVKTTKPFYVTRTDAAGTFSFTNIATGAYRIYALVDKNNSLTYDQDNERIGFLSDTINLAPTRPLVLLNTVRIDTRRPYIVKRTPQTDRVELEYNEGLTNINLLNQPVTDSLVYFLSENGKIATVFRKPEQKESEFIIQATDSASFKAIDTVNVTFTRPYRQEKFNLSIPQGGQLYTIGKQLKINADKPIASVTPGGFKVLIDSVVIHTISVERIEFENQRKTILLPPLQLPRNAKRFDIEADSGAVISLSGQLSPHYRPAFQVATSSNTGSVKGRITTSYAHFILQLLTQNYKVVHQTRNNKSFSYQNLAPGTYKLRLIVDINNNGVWDNADPDLTTLPEPVYFYREDIEIRANWELEDILFSTEKPVDNQPRK